MNPPAPIRDLPSVRRIIVRGVNWLGDAVMTTPALMRLRERFPETHIALLAPAKLKELWLNHPAVNETIGIEVGESVFQVAAKLRAGHYDLALVLPNSPRSAIESWLARIPRRVGYARPWRNFFLTSALPSPTAVNAMRKRSLAEIQTLIAENPESPTSSRAQTGPAHQTHDYLRLVGALGANAAPLAPHLAVTETELNDARVKFGIAQNSRPIFGLNPGAEYGPAKRWPASQFIAGARELQKKTDCVWLILGGKTDIALAEEIRLAISDLPAA
ncbi:MAG: hypothetical protein H7Y43_05020, partial [Akkermansiaceae bacterium]|nr:hypothetical protein [Verrucomicrobiales bacterium]